VRDFNGAMTRIDGVRVGVPAAGSCSLATVAVRSQPGEGLQLRVRRQSQTYTTGRRWMVKGLAVHCAPVRSFLRRP